MFGDQHVDDNFQKNPLKLPPGSTSALSVESLHASDIKTIDGCKIKGFGIRINSLQDAKYAISALYQDTFAAESSNIIYAYKVIDGASGMSVKGHDDDREYTAGSMLANFIEEQGHDNIFIAICKKGHGPNLRKHFGILKDLCATLTE